ncbi:MAG: hypothetical protein ACETWM_17255 [Candidatus Lokiarchaeia archaeon]
MISKEEVLKKIMELQEKYNYWFEVFRRTSDFSKKKEAKNKYQELIGEIIMLQNSHNLRVPPKYSNSERAKMELDNERERLILSKEQNLKNEFKKEKELLENRIKNNILKEKYKYIRETVEKMLSFNLNISNINNILDGYEIDILNPSSNDINKIPLINVILSSYFCEFYSGEMFVESYIAKSEEALNLFNKGILEEAEEIFKKAIELFDKASEYSELPSGSEYFKLEKQERQNEWDEVKKQILWEIEHLQSQKNIKEEALKIIKVNPGILQTNIYKIINKYEKHEISEALYYLQKNNKILREKKGNTYRLFIK